MTIAYTKKKPISVTLLVRRPSPPPFPPSLFSRREAVRRDVMYSKGGRTNRSVSNHVRRSPHAHAAQGGSAGEAQRCRRMQRKRRRERSRRPKVRILHVRCRPHPPFTSAAAGMGKGVGENVGLRLSEIFHREGLQREGGDEP